MKKTRRRKPRTHSSIEDAVYYAHTILGDATVCEITGKSASLVSKWADPDCDTHHVPLFQAVALDAHLVLQGHRPVIFEITQALIKMKVIALGGAPAHTPALSLARVMKIVGEGTKVINAYHATLADDVKLSPSLAATGQTEIDEVIRALKLLSKDIESHTFALR